MSRLLYMRLGFVGLGAMGGLMAKNLLAAGCSSLAVWDRTPERAQDLLAVGARFVPSPAEVARDAHAVVLMLTDERAAGEVLFGEGGVAEGLARGSAVIDMGTIGVAGTEETARRLAERGLRLIDAPVAGSLPAAKAGKLEILVGADEAALEEYRPVLEAMGDRVVHVGPVGAGTKMKLVNNLVMGANMAALAEGLALGEAAGLPLATQLEVLAGGGAASKILYLKTQNILAGSHEPEFKLSHQLKDLYYVLELARDLGNPLPVTGLVSQLYLAAMADHADEDMSAIAQAHPPGARTAAEGTRSRKNAGPQKGPPGDHERRHDGRGDERPEGSRLDPVEGAKRVRTGRERR